MVKEKEKVNLSQIARRCEVGAPTVSRVLNGYRKGFSVRPEVRQRILTVAREMGYRPNLAARNLRTKRTHLVAVLGLHSEWLSNPGVVGSMMGAATEVLHQGDYDVFACFPRAGRSNRELPPWRVDAAIVLSPGVRQNFEEIENAGIPYVAVNGQAGPGGFSVLVDDADGAGRALDHLYEQGHRKIAYVTDKAKGHISETARHDAYLQWMRRAGLPVPPGHDVLCESPQAYLHRMVAGREATAILVYSHLLAMDLLVAADALGLSVPRDVSLVCFNDEPPCQAVNPPLTAVGLPSRQMGDKAAHMLLDKLRNPDLPPRTITLPESLVVRRSVGRVDGEHPGDVSPEKRGRFSSY